MNHTFESMGSWMGGGMWLWSTVGILIVIVLAVLIAKLLK